jgi:hypothetical protein
MGVEPTRPLRVARFSKPARRTVSGYLPNEWTGWESNPTHRLCKSQSPPWNMPARICFALITSTLVATIGIRVSFSWSHFLCTEMSLSSCFVRHSIPAPQAISMAFSEVIARMFVTHVKAGIGNSNWNNVTSRYWSSRPKSRLGSMKTTFCNWTWTSTTYRRQRSYLRPEVDLKCANGLHDLPSRLHVN